MVIEFKSGNWISYWNPTVLAESPPIVVAEFLIVVADFFIVVAFYCSGYISDRNCYVIVIISSFMMAEFSIVMAESGIVVVENTIIRISYGGGLLLGRLNFSLCG